MKFAVGFLLALALIQVSTAFLVPELGPRITDAKDAAPGQFPYQVSIEFGLYPFLKYNHVCGGSIVSKYYILTAGHCAKGITFFFGKMRIKAGKHYLKSDDEHVQTIAVAKKIPHELFKGGITPKEHDIALLKLKKPLVFNERVQPVQLPEQDSVQSGEATLSGWGSISKTYLPKLPQILQYALLPILEQKECEAFFNGKRGSPGVAASMICSGPLGGSISACSGDSGGPLAQSVDGKAVQVGVVSWGVYPCGTAGAPSVYTRVASYSDWIKKKISN